MKIKLLIIISIYILCSCKTSKNLSTKETKPFNFSEDINESIIDGFFDGDTSLVPQNTYFLKEFVEDGCLTEKKF